MMGIRVAFKEVGAAHHDFFGSMMRRMNAFKQEEGAVIIL